MNMLKLPPDMVYMVRIEDTFNPPSPSCADSDHKNLIQPCHHVEFRGTYLRESSAKGIATKESKSYRADDPSINRIVTIIESQLIWQSWTHG